MKKIDMDEYKHLEEQFLTTQKTFHAKVEEAKEKLIEIQMQITNIFEPVEESYDDMDTARDSLKEFLDEQVGDLENYIGEKSEKWEEGVKGQAYICWKEHIEEVSAQLDESFSELSDIPEIDTVLDDINTEYEFDGLGDNFGDIASVMATV